MNFFKLLLDIKFGKVNQYYQWVIIMKERNEKIGRLWFEEMWSKTDLNLADKIIDQNYNPDWLLIDKVGPAQIKHEIKSLRSVFPDLKYEIIEINCEKDKVWVQYRGKATHTGKAW